MAIESSTFDGQVFQGLQEGQRAVESLNKQTNVEAFEDLREKMED